jgi:hypothetical protein
MITAPPPGKHKPLVLTLKDGSELIGWRVFDAHTQLYRYWVWSHEAKKPSKYTSTFQKAGMREVHPVSHRVHQQAIVRPPIDPISKRESEVILRRGVLTDGFRDKSDAQKLGELKSSWDSDSHNDAEEWNEAYGRHQIFARWRPEAFDLDNYLIAMSWFVKLGDGKRKSVYSRYSDAQVVVRWRSLDFSFAWIGEHRLRHVSGEWVRTLYNEAVDKVWGWAIDHHRANPASPIRRLHRSLWE